MLVLVEKKKQHLSSAPQPGWENVVGCVFLTALLHRWGRISVTIKILKFLPFQINVLIDLSTRGLKMGFPSEMEVGLYTKDSNPKV